MWPGAIGPSTGLATRPGARRTRRNRRWLVAILTVLLGGVILLTVMSSSASGPSPVALVHHRPLPLRHSAHVPAQPPTYGRELAPPAQRVSVYLKLPLTSGLLFNVKTGQVLWRRDEDRVLPIASLTKMMTALIVAARTQPTDQVLITTQAVHFSGSGVGLLPLGKRVDVLPLLYGLLLPLETTRPSPWPSTSPEPRASSWL